MLAIYINGEQKFFPELSTLQQLIETLGMKHNRIAVELNGEIIPRSFYHCKNINGGDNLEIITAVGGG